jgi:hypothetical protein
LTNVKLQNMIILQYHNLLTKEVIMVDKSMVSMSEFATGAMLVIFIVVVGSLALLKIADEVGKKHKK